MKELDLGEDPMVYGDILSSGHPTEEVTPEVAPPNLADVVSEIDFGDFLPAQPPRETIEK